MVSFFNFFLASKKKQKLGEVPKSYFVLSKMVQPTLRSESRAELVRAMPSREEESEANLELTRSYLTWLISILACNSGANGHSDLTMANLTSKPFEVNFGSAIPVSPLRPLFESSDLRTAFSRVMKERNLFLIRFVRFILQMPRS